MIRRATIDDIRPIYDMLEAYFCEAMQTLGLNLKWNKEKVIIQLGTWLWREELNVNLISDHGFGFMLGEIQETWFGGDRMAKPHVLYIKPDCRNGLLAREFMLRFESECKALGALAVVWDNWAGIISSGMLDSLMGHFGYHKRGGVYSKILDRGIYGVANPDLNHSRNESRQ